MNPDQLDPKTLAQIRRDTMRARAKRIRRSVIGLALALFTAAFVGIYVQLASGHDPALSKRQTTTSAAKAATKSPTSSNESSNETSTAATDGEATGSESSSTAGESTESEATGSEETTESPSAVTTRQS